MLYNNTQTVRQRHVLVEATEIIQETHTAQRPRSFVRRLDHFRVSVCLKPKALQCQIAQYSWAIPMRSALR